MMFQIRRYQALIVGVVFGLLLIFTARLQAAGVVAVCDEASLDAALAGGGVVSFTCSGTITITATKVVGANTIIDGAGQAVTISGGGAVSIFQVNPGVALTLRNLTIADGLNVGPFSQGGTIFNDAGTVTLNNSILTGHQAAFGGAIYNQGGTVTILNSTLTGNVSTLDVGGAIYSSGNVTVTNSTISNNRGHGIYNYGGTVTVTNSTFSGNNTISSGAAILNGINGTTTISGSTISGNTAVNGGGIDNNQGTLTVTNSSFVGNVANGVLGGSGGGGAIVINLGTVAIVNSTFANNQANFIGGGVYNAASVTITNSTFVGNQAANGGSGFWNALGTATIRNTIIANSPVGGNCFIGGGTVNGTMNNLDDDGSCPGFTQVTLAALNLGGLTGNPAYSLLLPGSVAIDAGSNGGCPATDQRGQARPTDGNLDGTFVCDVGAYEADGPLLQ
ncbi:MAG: right-handed parallel beta-helix repeat-containing protein, partial [Chitinophagaceae bacterium]|nr:right-handed parallel beta-helix repeat-containing protein [Anaerolineae bacterium]